MPITINGTTGISGNDGSAGTPTLQGTDTNTGIFFPAADTIAFAEGGTEVARFDSAGNLGIGTSSPATRLQVNGQTRVSDGTTNIDIVCASSTGFIGTQTNAPLVLRTNDIERARIDTSGNLLVGTTSQITTGGANSLLNVSTANNAAFFRVTGGSASSCTVFQVGANGASGAVWFNASGTAVGSVVVNVSSTTYATSSDYRLKENIQPMTGALAKVASLKPCTYKWKTDGSDGEGFIAHELQAVVPDAVVGEKDAVDAEGNPVYQGIDTSFLVATLTAAIQELKAIVDAQAVEIAQLKGQA